jgi:hypothetical protein
MQGRNNYAVSEVISVILVLGIIGASITSTLMWSRPYIADKKAEASMDSAVTQFGMMNEVVQDIVSQGAQCNSVFNFAINDGQVTIEPEGERFVIYYSLDPDFDFTVSGFNDPDDSSFRLTLEPCVGFTDYPSISADYLNGTIRSLTITLFGCGVVPPITLPCDLDISANNAFPLEGSVKIDITHSGSVVGRIWLFDTGSVTYQLSSTSGTQKVIFENGAVIRAYPSGTSWLAEEPVVFNRSGYFVLRMIQINGSESISGPGVHKINLKIHARTLPATNQPAYNYKMQIFGDYNETWYEFFRSKFGFQNFASIWLPGTGGSTPVPIMFTLSQSECTTYLGGIPQIYVPPPPEKPSNPSPPDGSHFADTNTVLEVDVSDPDGDSMDVTFYDASDDSVIDIDYGVPSGGTATVTWSGLANGALYSWYVIAEDIDGSIQSDTWSFTTIALQQMIMLQVEASSDDCEQSGRIYSDDTDEVRAGDIGLTVTAGFRFTNVDIPQNSIIISADLRLFSEWSANFGEWVKLKIRGIDEDDTPTWSSLNGPSARPKTVSFVNWEHQEGMIPEILGWKTPDDPITDLIQEIINKGYWDQNEALGLVIEENGSTTDNDYLIAHSWDNPSGNAPQLEITYIPFV